jgi:hypothetical protein
VRTDEELKNEIFIPVTDLSSKIKVLSSIDIWTRLKNFYETGGLYEPEHFRQEGMYFWYN